VEGGQLLWMSETSCCGRAVAVDEQGYLLATPAAAAEGGQLLWMSEAIC
jgi:hypothetical protein